MTTRSVIIPFHDAELYIGDLITSLKASVSSDTQVIFVDDHSSDLTMDLLTPALDAFTNATVIRNESNLGLAASRNRGLDRADGEHIFFIDADDWVAADYFDVISRALDDHGCDFVRVDQVRCYPSRREVVSAPSPRSGRPFRAVDGILPDDTATLVDYPYAHSGGFHRRLLDMDLLDFHPELRTAEDRPWIWRLHLHAETLVHLRYPGYFYRRQVATSLTSVGDSRQLDFLPAYHHTFDVVLAHRDADRYIPKLTRQFLAVAHHHMRLIERLDSSDQAALRAGILGVMDRIPNAALREGLDGSPPKRSKDIRRLTRSSPIADAWSRVTR